MRTAKRNQPQTPPFAAPVLHRLPLRRRGGLAAQTSLQGGGLGARSALGRSSWRCPGQEIRTARVRSALLTPREDALWFLCRGTRGVRAQLAEMPCDLNCPRPVRPRRTSLCSSHSTRTSRRCWTFSSDSVRSLEQRAELGRGRNTGARLCQAVWAVSCLIPECVTRHVQVLCCRKRVFREVLPMQSVCVAFCGEAPAAAAARPFVPPSFCSSVRTSWAGRGR